MIVGMVTVELFMGMIHVYNGYDCFTDRLKRGKEKIKTF